MDARLERSNAPTLFYQVEGAGPNVVLIHGVGADGSSWDEIAPALTPRFTVFSQTSTQFRNSRERSTITLSQIFVCFSIFYRSPRSRIYANGAVT